MLDAFKLNNTGHHPVKGAFWRFGIRSRVRLRDVLVSNLMFCLYVFFQMDVYKQPVTDPSKGSKRGRLSLRRNSDGFIETIERGAGKPEEVRPSVSLLTL